MPDIQCLLSNCICTHGVHATEYWCDEAYNEATKRNDMMDTIRTMAVKRAVKSICVDMSKLPKVMNYITINGRIKIWKK